MEALLTPPRATAHPRISGSLDCRAAPDDVIRVTGRGHWCPEDVDIHFAELDRMLRQRRAQGRGVRVLVDLRDAAVQSASAAARVQNWTGLIYTAEDKVAILLASSLLKAQMRRVAMVAKRELFLSESAALQWLTA